MLVLKSNFHHNRQRALEKLRVWVESHDRQLVKKRFGPAGATAVARERWEHSQSLRPKQLPLQLGKIPSIPSEAIHKHDEFPKLITIGLR